MLFVKLGKIPDRKTDARSIGQPVDGTLGIAVAYLFVTTASAASYNLTTNAIAVTHL